MKETRERSNLKSKRFVTQEMAREFSLFEEHCCFESQELNATKVAAAVQNAVQCYHLIYGS